MKHLVFPIIVFATGLLLLILSGIFITILGFQPDVFYTITIVIINVGIILFILNFLLIIFAGRVQMDERSHLIFSILIAFIIFTIAILYSIYKLNPDLFFQLKNI